ncbi:RNA-binding KH domain-containing protein RCF3, partial [Bienertia sinuspersici]
MSFSLTPAKRQHSRNYEDTNGKKFQKSANLNSTKQPRKASFGGAVFRVLCPSSSVESVIGNGSNIISLIRQQTGAKVRIDDSVPESDERVIFVMGPDKEVESGSQHKKNENEGSKSAQEQGKSEENNVQDANKEASATAEDLLLKNGTASVQKALLLVFENFFEGVREREEANKESNGSATVTLRLLVLSGQVGCLLGRGGSVIKQMSAESGAQIRVLPRDKLPQFASSTDEVVQITGLADAVKKAIKTVSDQIIEHGSDDHDSLLSSSSGPISHSHNNHVARHESYPQRSLPSHGPPFAGGFRESADFHSSGPPLFPTFHENFMPGRMDVPDFVTFRLLCPDERVGGVIGKGGAIIKTLQHETGCEIKVLEGTSNEEERMIVVSGPAHPDDRISAVQDAVLRVQNRLAKAVPDSKEKGFTAKLLVSSNQIGCLLGKGGSIISEMRKISGDLEVVQEALLQITTRLQHHFFRDAFPSINHPSNFAFSDRAPPLPPFMGRREVSPPGMFSNLGPSFRNFDSVGAPPIHGGFHPHDEPPPFIHDMHRQGISTNISERPWHPQNLIEGGPMGLLDHGGPPQRRMAGGFGGGSQQAVITNTTVEVVVPSSLVPTIYGEDGGSLRQIRQVYLQH